MISMNTDYIRQPTIDIILSLINVRIISAGHERDEVVEQTDIISAAANSLL